MGKYMKKPKLTGEVSLMELSTIGVRTRAKTLALQRLQNSNAQLDASSFCYLQLRSRRLEKCLPPIPAKKREISKESGNPNPNLEGAEESVEEKKSEAQEIEAGFEENNLDFDARDRGTRESTPCSFTRAPESLGTPASTTRGASSAEINRSSHLNCITPTEQEVEEFFSAVEDQDQKLFTEKYNFDVVNDVPLDGRYEWVPVTP